MTPRKCYADIETFSPVPITHGTHAYAEQAEVLLFTYALDDGDVSCWDVASGEPVPDDLRAYANDPNTIFVFHNGGMFDRVVLKHAMPWFYEAVPIERWLDTMVQAFAHSLPGSLGVLCEIFRLPQDQQKLKTGKQLIRLFCVPPAKNLKRQRATALTHPTEWQAFREYAMADIPPMRAIHKKMPMWNYRGGELALWQLDQRINNRGFAVDTELVQAALRAIGFEQARLADRASDLTEGAVSSATRRDAMLDYIAAEYGVLLDDLKGSTVDKLLDDDNTPAGLRALLSVRAQSTTTSTAKYKAFAKAVSSDGRMRGTMQFDGASRTARWAHRLVQPGNMPRPDMDQEEIDFCIEAIKADGIELVTDNVMRACSNAIRGCIVAPPGKKLVVSDLAGIENRVLAWMGGEDWKLQAFREYDAGTGPDLYKLAYAKSFGVPVETVTKAQRAIGKVQELALGYAGGAGAFMTFALAYRIDLDAMAKDALPSIPEDVLQEAREFLAWQLKEGRNTYGMSDEAFVACDALKRLWRAAHPATVALWAGVEKGMRDAIDSPGRPYYAGRFTIRRDANWLRVIMPSGRALCYPSPRIDEDNAITYMGTNQFTRKWERIRTYSGKAVENLSQATARDVLVHNMPAIDARGYHIILSVHDELLCETADTSDYNADELSALMSQEPDWAPDLPLAAAGFEAYRYKKD